MSRIAGPGFVFLPISAQGFQQPSTRLMLVASPTPFSPTATEARHGSRWCGIQFGRASCWHREISALRTYWIEAPGVFDPSGYGAAPYVHSEVASPPSSPPASPPAYRHP